MHYINCTIAVCVDMLWESLTGSGHLWTFADWQTLCPSTGHLHSPACPAACPLSTGLGQSCSTPQHHVSQPRAAWPWDAMDTVDTWTPKRCKKLQKDVQCIAFWSFWSFCIAMHCTLLLGFASRWTHRKAMNLSGHSLQRYEAKQIWLARLCSVPNFDRGWLEMVLHNHNFTLFTSYRQPNATVNECEWAMCNSCLATSLTFFSLQFCAQRDTWVPSWQTSDSMRCTGICYWLAGCPRQHWKRCEAAGTASHTARNLVKTEKNGGCMFHVIQRFMALSQLRWSATQDKSIKQLRSHDRSW